MYRIYDRSEAIKRVQLYLSVAGNPVIFVAPSGIFDENTILSVKDFQASRGMEPTGEVDLITFDALYSEYARITDLEPYKLDNPILPGDLRDEMMYFNRSMKEILYYYGFTSNLRDSNFYSQNTSEAVLLLREIYMLETKDEIDSELYRRMIIDLNSISKIKNIYIK